VLVRHLKTCKGGSSKTEHKCDTCQKIFSKKCLLKRHQNVHGEPTYSCSTCGKKYKRIDKFDNHISLCTKAVVKRFSKRLIHATAKDDSLNSASSNGDPVSVLQDDSVVNDFAVSFDVDGIGFIDLFNDEPDDRCQISMAYHPDVSEQVRLSNF